MCLITKRIINLFNKKSKKIDTYHIHQIEDPHDIKNKYNTQPWWSYCQICNEYYTNYISKESIYICKHCRLKQKYCE